MLFENCTQAGQKKLSSSYANDIGSVPDLLMKDFSKVIIHAEHVVHRRGYCFHFGCMYVCMYVSALERKRFIGMT